MMKRTDKHQRVLLLAEPRHTLVEKLVMAESNLQVRANISSKREWIAFGDKVINHSQHVVPKTLRKPPARILAKVEGYERIFALVRYRMPRKGINSF